MATGGVNNHSNGNSYVQHNSDINFKEKKYDLASIFKEGTVLSDDLKEIFAKVDENNNGIIEAGEIENLGLKPDKKYSLKNIMKMLGIKKDDAQAVKQLYTALESGNLSETETTRQAAGGYEITTRTVGGEKTIEIRDKDGNLRKQETTKPDGTKETFFYTTNKEGKLVKHQTIENPNDNSVERIFYDENDNPEQKQVEKVAVDGSKITDVYSLKNGVEQRTLSISEDPNNHTRQTMHLNEDGTLKQVTKDEMSENDKLQKRTTTSFGEKNTVSETVTNYDTETGKPTSGTTTIKVGDTVVREGATTYDAQGKKATETVEYLNGRFIKPNFGTDTAKQTSVTTYSGNAYETVLTTIANNGNKIVSTTRDDGNGNTTQDVVETHRAENSDYETTTSHYENGLLQSEVVTTDGRTRERTFDYDGDGRLVGERVEITMLDEEGNVVDHEVSNITYDPQDGSVLATVNSKEEVNGKVITQDFQRRDGYEIPGRKTSVEKQEE